MNNGSTKNIYKFLNSLAIYFLVSFISKVLLPEGSALYIAAFLDPFLGVCYGYMGALGIALGGLVADAITGVQLNMIVYYCISNFVWTSVSYLLWKVLSAGEDHIHRLDSIERVLKYAFIVLIYSLLSGLADGVALNFTADWDVWTTAGTTFLNNFDIGLLFGCPLMIASNQYLSRRAGTKRILSKNEKIILLASSIEFIGLLFMITLGLAGDFADPTDMWNAIYTRSAVLINFVIFAALIAMFIINEPDENHPEEGNGML